MLEMKVERLMPHTTDDDDRRYRPRDEVEEARKRDPVVTLADQLIQQGILTQAQVDDIRAEAMEQVDLATDAADAASPPDRATLYDLVYAP